MGDVLYPRWKEILEELWEERKKREINLVCLIGGIGVGKCNKYNSLATTSSGIYFVYELFEKLKNNNIMMQSESGFRKCLGKYDEGYKNAVEVTTHSGAWDCGTPHHRIRILSSNFKVVWKRLDEVEVGDYCIRIRNIDDVWGSRKYVDNFELTEKRCELVGLWIAEGHYQINQDVNAIMLSTGENLSEIKKLLGDADIVWNYSGTSRNCHRIRIKGEFKDVIRNYSKTGSGYKDVPIYIRESTKKNICAFLRGLFAGDGSFDKHKDSKSGAIEYSSKSKKLIEQVFYILWTLGIKSTLREKIVNDVTYYRLHITNKWSKLSFRELIGQTIKRRKDALDSVCYEDVCHRDNDREIIPHAKQAVEDSYWNIPQSYRTKKNPDYEKMRSIYISRKRQKTTKKAIRQMLDMPYSKNTVDPLLRQIVEEDWWLDPVIKVEKKIEYMYDFTVENDPSYVVNGFINHNTSVAGVIQCLMVFDLLSKFNPQKFYGLDPDSIIAIMSMSITTGQARKITFGKVYPKIVGSPFFRDYFPADPRLKREIRIPKAGISIFPGTSSELSALGFDLYGACLTGDTEILTTDGVKKIKDLAGKKNIELYSYNTESKKIEKSIGKGCYKIGIDHVFEMKLENGQKVKATENHGFLVREYSNNLIFKKQKDLEEGDIITILSDKKGIVFSPVESFLYCGLKMVYDIADVQPNNNFVSDNFFSHNTVDEANFLEVIEDSKRTGTADVYDAAEEMYNAVWTRMTSRFMRAGKVPGMIVMISSPRYPDDFLERKVQLAKEMGDKSRVFYKRLKMWEAKPQIWQGERIWSGDKFRFDVEEMRVIEEGDPVPTNAHGELHEIITPPIELKTEFEKSPERSLRDLDARPLLAISPYFRNKGKVKDALKKTIINPFNEKTLVFDANFKCEDNYFRYIHIDLGLKKDAVGIAMTHIPRFIAIDKTNIVSGNFTTEILNMPEIIVDFVGRVTAAQPGEEILFSDVQEIIYQLTDLGFFISLISFDKFQSSYIQQQLRDDGYTVAELSMDRTSSKIIVDHDQKTERGRRDGYRKESTGRQYTAAYQSLKDAMYEDRIKIPYHEYLLRELLRLESIRKNNIDLVTKPNKGSDDVAQALAGSVFNAVCNEIPMVEVDQDRGSGKDSMYDDFYDDLEDSLLDDGYTDDGDGGDDFYERYND